MPQLQEDNDNFILVQDGALPHWHLDLYEKLPRHWIGRSTAQNMLLHVGHQEVRI
jgi:hypothetical protein